MSSIILLIFCLLVLSVTERGMLNSPKIIVDFPPFLLGFHSYILKLYFLNAETFRIMSFWDWVFYNYSFSFFSDNFNFIIVLKSSIVFLWSIISIFPSYLYLSEGDFCRQYIVRSCYFFFF